MPSFGTCFATSNSVAIHRRNLCVVGEAGLGSSLQNRIEAFTLMESNDHAQPGEHAASDQPGGDAAEQSQVQALTWALLDERITGEEMALLDHLLRSSAAARDVYMRCVQLHADLSGHFAAFAVPAPASATARSPVLGFLCTGTMPLELQTPSADEAAT
jgi:hypothetical protein